MNGEPEVLLGQDGARQALRLPATAATRLGHLFRRQPEGHPLLPLLRLYRSRPEPVRGIDPLQEGWR